MRAITTNTMADEAYGRIADAIFDGSIEPGAHLVMDELADRLGVSRTPVRDALRQLERDGLIRSAGRRGYMTVTAEPDYRRHIYESRTAIETFAAAAAATRPGPAFELVTAAIDRAVTLRPETSRGAYEANRLVHRAIVEATENPVLLGAFDLVWDRGRSHRLYANCFRFENSADAFRAKHEPIAAAIGSGDPDAARAAMTAHLEDGLALGPA